MQTIAQVLAALNTEQHNAVFNTLTQDTLLLAGPGSGKTATLKGRYLHLIDGGVYPSQIMAITFTNKAAGELRERIGPYLKPEDASKAWIGTFHSTCIRLLHIYGKELGITNFTITDMDDQKKIIKEIMSDNLIEGDKKQVMEFMQKISGLKGEFKTPDDYTMMAHTSAMRQEAIVYKAYEDYLRAHDLMDFDDCIVITARALEANPIVKQKINDRFKYLMIDECQDTDTAQHRLIKLLAGTNNIFMVGDTDQSLYSWRGARPDYLVRFLEHYPNGQILELTKNYRSTGHIIKAGNALIKQNVLRYAKEMTTNKADGHKVNVCEFQNGYKEAESIAWNIRNIHNQFGYEWGDIVILYRINSQSRIIEDEMVKKAIPYKIIGGVGFYERKEIKDLTSYLRALTNPNHDLAMRRILELQPGIGKTAVTNLYKECKSQSISLYDHLLNLRVLGKIKPAVLDFVKKFEQVRYDVIDMMMPIRNSISAVIKEFDYVATLSGDPKFDERIENLDELKNLALDFEKQNPGSIPDMAAFLERMTLSSDADEIDGENTVKMMTGHAAKGLEFKVVFIVNCEEGIIPHVRCAKDPKQLEEERRIMFVMITRSEELCFISYSKERRDNTGTVTNQIPSRFIGEIPFAHKEFRKL